MGTPLQPAPSAYNWPHLAQLATPFGVDPQVMLACFVAQGHHLVEVLGEDEVIRELMIAALGAKAVVPDDIEEMYDEALQTPCEVVPGVRRIREQRLAGEKPAFEDE